MRAACRLQFVPLLVLAAAVLAAPRAARADVTIQQQTTFDFAFIKAHGTATESTATERQRQDFDLHCEGLMSMFCGNAQSGQIIRLDRGVEWALEPKKMEYQETALPTAAERAAARAEAQAMMEKIKQCPAVAQQPPPGPDTSKCEMSPPKVEVKQPGIHATLAGHDAQLTQMALTRSCTDKTTGDVCDFLFALDSWLTQDEIAGIADQKSFLEAYRAKLGIDPRDPAIQKQMRQFLAPYSDTLKEVSAKSEGLKGYPLKTVLRIAFGGEHCAAVKNKSAGGAAGAPDTGDAAAASAASAAGAAAGAAAGNAAKNSIGSSALSSAANALGSKLAGGLFSKKKADTPAPASPTESTLPAGMIQAAQISVETTSISTAGVPSDKFEIPSGWKRIEPQAKGAGPKEFSCPKAGS